MWTNSIILKTLLRILFRKTLFLSFGQMDNSTHVNISFVEKNVYLFLISVKITILATNLIGSITNFLRYSMLYADFEFITSVPTTF